MLVNCVMVSVLRPLQDTVCPLLALFFQGKVALRKSKTTTEQIDELINLMMFGICKKRGIN